MVIVSDGRVSPVDNTNATIAAARSAENQGIRIIALAFYTGGTNVGTGTNLMREIPSFPHDYSFVASTAIIQSNFGALADGLCRTIGNGPPSVTITSPTNSVNFQA